MFVKALIIVGALLALGIFVSRALRGAATAARGTRNQGTRLDSQDLVKCSTCGIYLPAGQTCDCRERT